MAAVDIITSYNTGNWWFPSVHLMVVDLGEKKLLPTSCFSFLRRFLTEKSYSEVVKWPFWLMQKTKIKICSRVSTFTVDQLHSRGEIMAIISACHQVEFNAKWLKCWGLPGTGPVPRRLLHLCEVSPSPEPVTSVKLDRNVTDTPSSIWNIGPFPSCLTVRHTLPLTAGGGGLLPISDSLCFGCCFCVGSRALSLERETRGLALSPSSVYVSFCRYWSI